MRDPDDFLVSRLRFKHLALVEALDRLHSIRKAAQAIHVSEPAVSKALTEVEASFGFALFERSPAGVTSTERGRVVIEGARLLLNSLRHVLVAAANAEAVLRGCDLTTGLHTAAATDAQAPVAVISSGYPWSPPALSISPAILKA
jgi:DNA-binding transcriptional LysR family regulator